ncbi:hypothetical protein [Chryseobacterium sp.]|uniref:hypothetical protein n=2 Tax=unclassified Chryseobacterium TaxID=2593645 RepID=UPI00262AC92C|nr:hypothetical protein [Chryseobacterium sp.]
MSPFTQIDDLVEKSLMGKHYSKNGDKYVVNSDSGIEYIEATSDFVKVGQT